MQMVGAFAEFERAMIRERTSAGLAAARAEGRIGGRRRKLDDTKRREIGGHLRSEDCNTDGADVRRVATDCVTDRRAASDRACLTRASPHLLSGSFSGRSLRLLGACEATP